MKKGMILYVTEATKKFLSRERRWACPGDCPSRIHYNGKHGRDHVMCLIYQTIVENLGWS